MTIRERLKSRKLWLGLAGAIMPIVTQIATGAVTWPVAVVTSAGIVVSYLVAQGGVDKAAAQAAGKLAEAGAAAAIDKIEDRRSSR